MSSVTGVGLEPLCRQPAMIEHVRAHNYNTSTRLSAMDSSTTDTEQTDQHSRRAETEPDSASAESSTDSLAVIADSTYSKAQFIEPTTLGYIHIGAEVQPSTLPITLFPPSAEKATLLEKLKQQTQQLEEFETVETATVFKAVTMPPFHRFPYIKDHIDSLRLAQFDIAILIETSSPAVVPDVRDTTAYQTLVNTIQSEATQMHVMAARNKKRIDTVNKARDGLFIFNHFVADDPEVLLELFDHLAGGYVAETGLDNSTLLVPLDEEKADFVAINNAQWDISRFRFVWREMTNPGLRKYVQTHLEANQAGSMPVLYRLA
ncbi:hypothetical protein [Halocatena marina]|uniref:Uncharacterized protein n=2 Tax=Halocatena marina TaxID=2934937 RepID=A0ABD5YWE4_9EURY|nr:hypothetical protein [Halocatena marina]